MSNTHVVTNLEQSPQEERKRRFVIYTISMIIRFACVASVVFTSGVWQWICGIGAVFLPYFAVVVGNNVGAKTHKQAQVVVAKKLQIDVGEHLKEMQ